MPTEPPPSPWEFGDPGRLRGRGVRGWDDPVWDDPVAVGADLAPGTLLAAYRRGLFPMPSPVPGRPAWFCPVRRGILPVRGLRVSRSLARSARRFEIRVDSAFAQVVDGCADPRRPAGWIDAGIRAAYQDLHDLGWAHSVEAWREGALAGGLYGVAIGGLFAGESMFFRERDASKVALMGLVDLLGDEHAEGRLLDVQWRTPHLASLGVVEVSRREYLSRLRTALTLPLPARWR